MEHPFEGKYPYCYKSDGTANGFYACGSVREYSKHTSFYSYVISRGYDELVEEGDHYEPPRYEPVETEMIIVRPKLKFPKR